MKKNFLICAVAFSLAVVLVFPAFSGRADASEQSMPTLRDASSIRSAGMGNATRAFASSDEALLINPAGMSAVPRFNISASATFEVPKDRGLQLYSVTAIDSMLNSDTAFPLGGGVSYTYYRSGYGEQKRSGSLTLVGLSLPLVHQHFTLGITGKWLKFSGAAKTNAVTMDAGITISPVELIHIGAVGYNLIDVSSVEAMRAWGFGLAIGTDATFHVSGDMKLEQRPGEKKWRISWSVGGEYLFGKMFMPRVGYENDAIRGTHKAGGGLSVFFSGLAVEAAYQYIFDGSHYFGVALRVVDFG